MATENKYKKGDWVRCVKSFHDEFTAGKAYKVSMAYGDRISVELDDRGSTTNGWIAEKFEPWRPKVGERVRVAKHVNSYGDPIRMDLPIGSIHTVTRVGDALSNKDRPSFTLSGSDVHFYLVENLEPVTDTLPVAEQPAARENAGGGFKAGDKIELVQGEIDGVREIGDVYEAVAHQKPAHKDSVCHLDKDGKVTWAPGHFFKLHEPITIQAGRFYKTRDGRKVGPMKPFLSDRLIAKNGDGNIWMLDGKAGTGNVDKQDLVAEWVDTPVRDITAATVDAINDEYGTVVAVVGAPKFKVGDRVVSKGAPQAGVGVVETVKGAGRYTVNFKDTWFGVCHECDDSIQPAPTPAIVCKIDNGQPLPASRPAVHATVESGDAEAQRLANLHTGQEFGVYALTGTPHRVARVYEHEWQRLAAAGEKIQTIKALRDMAALDLVTAKRAVEVFIDKAA